MCVLEGQHVSESHDRAKCDLLSLGYLNDNAPDTPSLEFHRGTTVAAPPLFAAVDEKIVRFLPSTQRI